MAEWALPEYDEENDRVISGHHVLLHITGADCPCNEEAEQAYYEELAREEERQRRLRTEITSRTTTLYMVNVWSTSTKTKEEVTNPWGIDPGNPPF